MTHRGHIVSKILKARQNAPKICRLSCMITLYHLVCFFSFEMLFLVLAEAKMSSFNVEAAQKFKIQIQTKHRIREEEELKTEKS